MQIDCLDVRCPHCKNVVYMFAHSYVTEDELDDSDGIAAVGGLDIGMLGCPRCLLPFYRDDVEVIGMHDFDNQTVQRAEPMMLKELRAALAEGAAKTPEQQHVLQAYIEEATKRSAH
jgi:hypothetical protein